MPNSILKIINLLTIDETSYSINNICVDSTEILIFSKLNVPLNNLPINLKQLWIKTNIKSNNIKLPLNCELKFN